MGRLVGQLDPGRPPAGAVVVAAADRLGGQAGRRLGVDGHGGGEADGPVADHPQAHAQLGVVGRGLDPPVAQRHVLGADLLDAHLGVGGPQAFAPRPGPPGAPGRHQIGVHPPGGGSPGRHARRPGEDVVDEGHVLHGVLGRGQDRRAAGHGGGEGLQLEVVGGTAGEPLHPGPGGVGTDPEAVQVLGGEGVHHPQLTPLAHHLGVGGQHRGGEHRAADGRRGPRRVRVSLAFIARSTPGEDCRARAETTVGWPPAKRRSRLTV